MVVVDEEQHVGFAVCNPLLHGFEVRKDGCPHRVVLLVAVKRKTNGGGVGRGDSANDSCHVSLSR